MSTTETAPPPSPPPILNHVTFADVTGAIREGLADFLKAPWFGLFFAAFYVAGGLVIFFQLKVICRSPVPYSQSF